MIIYAAFVIMMILGLGFFAYGFMKEIETYSLIGNYFGISSFLPESAGWFLIGFIFLIITIIAILFRVSQTGCSKRFDKLPKGKGLFNFLYRDGTSTDIIGMRRVGLGIFDVPEHGVIIDIGRLPNPGSVYRFGGKNIRFALQDINFTPNPKFTTIYSFFTELGINNADELYDVLNGYNPELIIKVWNRLCYYSYPDATDKIVQNIQDMTPKEKKQLDKDWRSNIDKDKKKQEKELDSEETHRNITQIIDKFGGS